MLESKPQSQDLEEEKRHKKHKLQKGFWKSPKIATLDITRRNPGQINKNNTKKIYTNTTPWKPTTGIKTNLI